MFRELVKRRLADAALMEMRLNERKQQNEHNQKKGIVNREIIPQPRRNVYPERRFWVHIAETCTRKGGFGYMWEWQELMESNHRLRIWNPLFSSLN